MIKVFSTFTGIGSFEIALRNLKIDFESVGISDVDKYALIAYDAIHNDQSKQITVPDKQTMIEEFRRCNIAYNFSTGKSEIPKSIEDITKLYIAHKRSKNYGDIRKINEKKLPKFDLFTYSFPCKNISTQGKRAGFEKNSGTQSSLVWESERIISYNTPKYLIMENVKGITSDSNKQLFDQWIDILKNLDYNSYYDVLDAKNFNLPQHRERFMMVSIRKDVDDGSFYLPKKSRNMIIKNIVDIIDENPLEEYYLSGNKHKSVEKIVDSLKQKNMYEKIINDKKRKNQIRVIGNLEYEKFMSKSRVFHIYGLCPTLDSMSHDSLPKIFINDRVRRVTPIEAWRIMGMSDDDFYRTKNIGQLPYAKLHERAGRAIAVTMLEEIFKNLFLKKEKIGLFF